MKLTTTQRLELLHSRIEASHSMLNFAMARASDSMAEFAFAMACSEGTDAAKRAQEIADGAIARAGITAPPSP